MANQSKNTPPADSLCTRVEAYIQEQPVKALLIALVMGLFFGRIVL